MTSTELGQLVGTFRLAEPWGLIALVVCVLPWIAARRRARLAWPTLDGFRGAPAARAGPLRHLPNLLKCLAIACLAVALARPQTVGGQVHIAAKGVAIEVAIDRSASMTTEDFPTESGKTSRLVAAKATLERFIAGREDDLVGVIAFANVPARVAPPTLDHGFLQDAVRAIRPARAGEGGTSLGLAIAMELGELKPLSTPRKVAILLTDGRDSPAASEGFKPIVPDEAASLARRLGITLHTIAVGGPGTPATLEGPPKSGDAVADPGPDLERLKTLATLGGGRAFVATDADSLEAVFKAIDALERSPVAGTVHTRYRERYPAWIAAALVLILLDRLLESGPLLRLP